MFTGITVKPATPFAAGVLQLGPRGRALQLFPVSRMSLVTALGAVASMTIPALPQAVGTVSSTGIAYLISSSDILAGQAVVTLDGLTCLPCDTGNEVHGGKIYGVAIEDSAAGAPCRINTASVLAKAGWNWVSGGDIFANGVGGLTQVPNESAAFMQRVGYATGVDRIMVSIADPIYL